MRKSKKYLMRSGLAGLLIASLAVGGGTLAYLTDTETADNTFTVGKVKIDLEEPNYPGNDSDEVKAIVPNQTVAKDPQIENTGNNEAIVYLKVEVPQEEYTELGADNVPGEKKLQDLFALKDVSDQWELIRTETTTADDGKTKTSYVYAYKKPLGKSETTDKLFQKVQMKNSMESDLAGNVEDIIVTAYAIQSTDVSDISLTPAEDGTLGKDVLDQVYEIFLNQSGQETPRPADEGDRPQNGKLGKITYDLNGGSLEGELTEYDADDYGYTPPTPTKEGYIFTGWTPATLPADSTKSVKFTANWNAKTSILLDGVTLNKRMKSLAGNKYSGISNDDYSIKSIQRSNNPPAAEIISNANSLISTRNSDEPTYMWYEEDGIIKWWSSAGEIKSGTSLSNLCRYMRNLTDIDGLSAWNTENTTDMNCLFEGCRELVKLTGLKNWCTENVTDMSKAFAGAASTHNYQIEMQINDLTPLANWNTSHVTNMDSMFYGCSHIQDLSPLKNWDTSNVTSMSYMFAGHDGTTANQICEMSISDLKPLTNWDTSHVKNMSHLFYNCVKIDSLSPLTNWDTSNVAYMNGMFYCCNFTNVTPLKDWTISSVTDLSDIFAGCNNLSDITPLSNWDIQNVTNIGGAFRRTSISDLTSLKKWNTNSVTDMSSLFSGTNISDLTPLKDWDTNSVTNMSSLFSSTNISDLTPLKDWNVNNVTNMSSTFNYCVNLADLSGIENWNTANVADMSFTFYKCTKLDDLSGIENWNTGNVKYMNSMFALCKGLTDSSAINDWDILKVTTFKFMFEDCPSHPEFTKRAGTWAKGTWSGTFEPTT